MLGVVEVCANIASLLGTPNSPVYLALRGTAYVVATVGFAYLLARVVMLAGTVVRVFLRQRSSGGSAYEG